MIKFISPEPNGGMPFEIEDLLKLQDGLYQGLSFLCNAAGTPFILSGCEVTTSTATTCTVNAGWVWLEGDFRSFPGYTGTYPFYIVKDNSKFYTKTFENGTVQNALVDAFAKAVNTVARGQENIPMNPGSNQLYKTVITNAVATDLAAEIAARINGDSTLQSAIDTINQILPTKANKLFTAIPWTDITLDTAYVAISTGVQKPQYMLDELGTVHLRGSVISAPNSTAAAGAVDIGIGFIPITITAQNDLRLASAMTYQTEYYNSNTGNLTAYPNGAVAVKRGAGDVFIGGKARSSGIGVGQIRCYLEYPLKTSLIVSLDGISWNINP